MQGIPVDLVPLPSNTWPLQGLLPGVYTLNVNVAMSSSSILGTYETILVILGPDQQPLPPTTIINQITIRQPDGGCPGNLTLIDGKCRQPSPSPGPCPTPSVTPCPSPPIAPGITPPIAPGITPPIAPEGQIGTPPNCEIPPEAGGDGGIDGNELFNGEGGGDGSGGDEGGDEGSGGDEGGDEGSGGDEGGDEGSGGDEGGDEGSGGDEGGDEGSGGDGDVPSQFG
jgi:hypothetical protein